MIPTERADSMCRIRMKRILSQQREFVIWRDFPKPIGGGFGLVVEFRFTLAQSFLRAFALRQIDHERNTFVATLFKARQAD